MELKCLAVFATILHVISGVCGVDKFEEYQAPYGTVLMEGGKFSEDTDDSNKEIITDLNTTKRQTLPEAIAWTRPEQMGIVPDLVDENPLQVLHVRYRNENDSMLVDFGTILLPSEVKDPPNVTWNGESGKFYLLMMIDPDAPSFLNHSLRSVNHWMIGNIPALDLDKGDLLVEYVGAGPPKRTEFHRYVFILYQQPRKLKFEEPIIKAIKSQINLRVNFSHTKFAEKYRLGKPLASNFFLAKWNEYVDVLLAQLM